MLQASIILDDSPLFSHETPVSDYLVRFPKGKQSNSLEMMDSRTVSRHDET